MPPQSMLDSTARIADRETAVATGVIGQDEAPGKTVTVRIEDHVPSVPPDGKVAPVSTVKADPATAGPEEAPDATGIRAASATAGQSLQRRNPPFKGGPSTLFPSPPPSKASPVRSARGQRPTLSSSWPD